MEERNALAQRLNELSAKLTDPSCDAEAVESQINNVSAEMAKARGRIANEARRGK